MAEKRGERVQDRSVRARVPVDVPRMHLEIPVPEGYFGYWFNDVPGRIQSAQKAGYTFVDEADATPTDDMTETGPGGAHVSRVVGTNADGSARVAYFMKIPREWYDEDQEKLLAHPKEVMEQIKTGKVAGDEKEDTSHRYGSLTAKTVLAR